MLSRVMLAIGGLVVLALFAALLAPLFVDWTGFRQEFEREASRIVGRKVVVHGSVDARLIPFPSVTLNDVRVGEEDGTEPSVTIRRFSMDAELAPILSGEALIFDMRVEEPKVRLKLLSDGTLDWARGRKADIPAKTVVLENVEVTGGEIEFVDEQAGRTRRFTGLDARLSARSLGGPWRVDGRGAVDGTTGSFQMSTGQLDDGVLKLKARIVPDSFSFTADLDGDLKVVDFRPQYNGTFALAEKKKPDGRDPDNSVRVSGDFELSNERLRVPQYHLEAGDPADPYIVTGEATLDTGKAPEFLLIADGQQIDVNRIGNNGERGKTGRNPEATARQRLQGLLAILADIPVPQVPGRASLKLPAIVIGDTTVREVLLDVEPDGDGWIVARSTAQFPGRTTVEAKGRLTLKGSRRFTGDLLVASNQPSGLAAWLAGSVDPEIRKLKSAGFAAKVDLTAELQRFENLELAAGAATLKGRIERQSRPGEAPALSIELGGNRVEIETLQALAGLVAGDASTAALLHHSIALDLKAEHFAAFGEEARDVRAVLSLQGGMLNVSRLDVGSVAGATVSVKGQVGGTVASPSAGLDLSLRAGRMQPVIDLLARHLPPHPVLTRLVGGAGYYDDADLKMTLALPGDKDGPVGMLLAGSVNGGRVDARLSARDFSEFLAGGNIEAQGTLENPSTVALAGQLGLEPLPFDAEPNGIAAVKIVQPLSGPANVTFSFTTSGTSISADGSVDLTASHFLDGQLDITASSGDIEPFLVMNGVVLPQTGSGLPVALRAKAIIDATSVRLEDVDGKIDRNGLSGMLVLDRAAPTLKGSGSLSFDTIDLAWLAEGVLGPIEDPGGQGFNPSALGIPTRDNADLDIRLAAEQFWAGLYEPVEHFNATLNWTGGGLSLDDLAGDWLGGSLAGRLTLANAEGNGLLEARLKLSGADVSRIVWAGADGPVAAGRADMTLALDASGKNVASMLEATSGSGEVQIGGLTLGGITSDAFGAILASADAIEGEITETKVDAIAVNQALRGETRLDGVTIPFTIASGKLRAETVTGEDGAAEFAGGAELDLPGRMLSGQIAMRLKAGEEAVTGGEPEIVLAFDGPIAAPTMRIDAQPLSNYLSLRKFERERRRVEMLQAAVLEKQRLRREAALYRSRAQERAALAEAMRIQAIEEERRRQAAKEQAERERQEREARIEAERRAAEQARQSVEPGTGFRVSPNEGVIREDLPPIGGQNLNFDALPGVN
nr:AsmA family protein [Mycoplana sp. BE70]